MTLPMHGRQEHEGCAFPPVAAVGDTSGWSILAKTIRDVDKSKVQDCKEDIDTLLVFAGLFSAVMTAFLMQSYPTLQENPADTTVALLQRIVSRMDGLSPGGSGDPSPSSATFEISSTAILVNALWFASLLFSLMSASFGILVKQWLRQYLAIDSTFPQAQLRIRYFRSPSLTTWKVFEIAAVLPLLLQLSLGLFFLGLCFFTWGIHPTLGKTSIPIICAWAFFLGLSGIAPVFSTRCPYKSSLFSRSVKVIRRRLRRILQATRGTLLDAIRFARQLYTRTLIRGITNERDNSFSLSTSISIPSLSSAFPHTQFDVLEEEAAALSDEADLDVLIAADAYLADDDLLCKVIVGGALQSLHAIDWIRFLRRVICNRLQRDFFFQVSHLPPDLVDLPLSTYEAIVHVLERVLRRVLDKLADNMASSDPWLRQCLEQSFILLLHSSANRLYPLPTTAIHIIQSVIRDHPSLACQFLGCAFFHLDNPRSVLLFGEVVPRLPLFLSHLDGKTMFSYLEKIVAWRVLCAESGHADCSLPDESVRLTSHSTWASAMDPEAYRYIIWMLSVILKQETDAIRQGTAQWSEWLDEVLRAYIHMRADLHTKFPPLDIARLMDHGPSDIAFAKLFVSQESTTTFFQCISSYKASMVHALMSYINRDMVSQDSDCSLSTEALHYICDYLKKERSTLSSPKPMRLCFLAVHISLMDPDAPNRRDIYLHLFSNIQQLLSVDQASEEERTLARQCLSRIQWNSMEAGPVASAQRSIFDTNPTANLTDTLYSAWLDAFHPSATIYEDALISLLHLLSGDSNVEKFRIKRLIDLGLVPVC